VDKFFQTFLKPKKLNKNKGFMGLLGGSPKKVHETVLTPFLTHL